MEEIALRYKQLRRGDSQPRSASQNHSAGRVESVARSLLSPPKLHTLPELGEEGWKEALPFAQFFENSRGRPFFGAFLEEAESLGGVESLELRDEAREEGSGLADHPTQLNDWDVVVGECEELIFAGVAALLYRKCKMSQL